MKILTYSLIALLITSVSAASTLESSDLIGAILLVDREDSTTQVVIKLDESYNLTFDGMIEGQRITCSGKSSLSFDQLISYPLNCGDHIIGSLNLNFSKVDRASFLAGNNTLMGLAFALRQSQYRSPIPWQMIFAREMDSKKLD